MRTKTPGCRGAFTPVGTRKAVGGGRTAVGGLPAPGTADPLRLIGLEMPEGGLWLAMMPETKGWITDNKRTFTLKLVTFLDQRSSYPFNVLISPEALCSCNLNIF